MKSALHAFSPEKKLSMNMGELVPIGLMEVLPGDKIDHLTTALIRTSPLVTPVMHEVDIQIHHWFVPERLIFDDFEKFITGGPDGLDATVSPYVNAPAGTGFLVGSLADYLGVPVGVPNLKVSAKPFRAYDLIYNNWYRDEQLQAPVTISTAAGADVTTSLALQNGCWMKDRFTSARPNPQLGTAVTISLAGNAPVVSTGGPLSLSDTNETKAMNSINATNGYIGNTTAWTTSGQPISFGSDGSAVPLRAVLTGLSAIDIDDLREASAVQRFKENMNMTGARYVERLKQAFGVRPQDARLQLPEYLGGGSQKIQFSEVLQTAEGANPVGEMAGHGIAGMRSNKYKRMIPEHGYIITLMVVRPKTQYMQGLPKLWSRDTKYDYFQPELQYLGDVPIKNKEVYALHTTPDGVFGYQNIWDDYRYLENTVAGEFRTLLKDWHMAREFSSDPALNATFVAANPTTRIYASSTTDQLYVTAKHKIKARRRVIKHAKPMLY